MENNLYDGTEFRLGLIVPLSGTHQNGGHSMERGVELAVNTINKNGGIDGMKINLLVFDDVNNPSVCREITKDLIIEEKADALIGPYSSECCLAIMDIVNEYKVPLITPVAMADKIIQGNDYIFRNTLSCTMALDKINKFTDQGLKQYTLLDGFGAHTIGFIWQNDAWGYEMQQKAISDLQHLGRSDAVLFTESFELGTDDFFYFYDKYKSNFPDIIYVISSGDESINLVKDGREAGFKGLFFGEGGFNYSNFDEELGELADGCLFSTQWHPSFSTPMSDVFVNSYTQEYEDTPDMFAAISYEAVYILKNSVIRLKSTISKESLREDLQAELSIPRRLDGISGKISFDTNGQCDRPMFILQKRWTGKNLQSFIIFPTKYSQGDIQWNFNL
jgi:branched-chain amino acid transport system substrate-binding protein